MANVSEPNDAALLTLLRALDQAYEKRSWHGTNLRGSLRGLTAAQASWRPGPDRKNIWEHVLHAAYWKYVVRRKLTGEKRGSFPLKGSNWFERPTAEHCRDTHWRDDLALLDEQHRLLRKAVEGVDVRKVQPGGAGGPTSPFMLISGVAAHDLYHTGQIQLIKRLQNI